MESLTIDRYYAGTLMEWKVSALAGLMREGEAVVEVGAGYGYHRRTQNQHITIRYFQHAHLIPIVGVGKERHTLIGLW